jgi:hypothetical protein
LSANDGTGPILVVLDGDSTMQGFTFDVAAYNADYTTAATLAKLLPRGSTVKNRAIGGTFLQTYTQPNFATNIAPLLAGNYQKKVYVLGSTTNDILNAVGTSADLLTSTQTVVNAAKALGALVVVRKCPLVTYPTAIAYNSGLSGLANIDAVFGVRDDPYMANPNYNRYSINGGQIHLTELGYIRQGQMLARIIEGLPNSGTGAQAASYLFATKRVDSLGNAVVHEETLTINP